MAPINKIFGEALEAQARIQVHLGQDAGVEPWRSQPTRVLCDAEGR